MQAFRSVCFVKEISCWLGNFVSWRVPQLSVGQSQRKFHAITEKYIIGYNAFEANRYNNMACCAMFPELHVTNWSNSWMFHSVEERNFFSHLKNVSSKQLSVLFTLTLLRSKAWWFHVIFANKRWEEIFAISTLCTCNYQKLVIPLYIYKQYYFPKWTSHGA